MKKIIFSLLFIVFSILIISLSYAYFQKSTMPLLAVKETASGYEGSTAELTLEIKEGTGRVFVDTFPLSKIDTQVSMRLAKEIACDFLEVECSNYDFIYTITASSPIISGPSAGAAAASLTVSALSETPIKKEVTMTGTINSGGLIGPVGGLKEKIEAAGKAGIKVVLIPESENEIVNDSGKNLTINEYANKLGIKVTGVANLNTALEIFTGKTFKPQTEDISINPAYKEVMKSLAKKLCDRNLELKNNFLVADLTNKTSPIYEAAINLSKKGMDASKKEEYYSAASYCFGSNVKFNQLFLEEKNFSQQKYQGLLTELSKDIAKFDKNVSSWEIKTITDLESYMVVKERLIEAMETANSTGNFSYSYAYAYASERLLSAYSWAEFFNHQGKVLSLDKESLKLSCQQRIAEAEERLQYLSFYIPFRPDSPRDELDKAYTDFNNNEYALCLFKASQAKAEANIILNTLGLEQEFVPKLIEDKLNSAAMVISKSEKKNIFPILGYSYYEYALNLKESDPFSALLYAEYALELSNLDAYFKEKKALGMLGGENKIRFYSYQAIVIAFSAAAGLFIGIGLANIYWKRKLRKKPRR